MSHRNPRTWRRGSTLPLGKRSQSRPASRRGGSGNSRTTGYYRPPSKLRRRLQPLPASGRSTFVDPNPVPSRLRAGLLARRGILDEAEAIYT